MATCSSRSPMSAGIWISIPRPPCAAPMPSSNGASAISKTPWQRVGRHPRTRRSPRWMLYGTKLKVSSARLLRRVTQRCRNRLEPAAETAPRHRRFITGKPHHHYDRSVAALAALEHFSHVVKPCLAAAVGGIEGGLEDI